MKAKYIFRNIFIVVSLAALTTNAMAAIELGNGSASGQWYDPNRNGEGFFVEEIGEGDNRQIAVAMYSFDESGNQLWFSGSTPITPGDLGAIVPVIQVDGPMWGSGFDPADANITEFGTVTVNFTSCTTALFSVESDIPELESFDYSTVRLTSITSVSCQDQPIQEPGMGITPGLWLGPGGCFFVNAEGTKLVESDLCDNGKALSGEYVGIEININGQTNAQACQANAVCDDVWDICMDCYPVSVSCTTGGGSAANVFFESATSAKVELWQGGLGKGAVCYSTFTANPE